VVLLWIGSLKIFAYEAESIVPFVANSSFMSFFYQQPDGEYRQHLNREGERIPANREWHKHAAAPMITKCGLETVTRHLAMDYAKDGIRVNTVAPGVVPTPLHKNTPKDVMESLSPMGRASTVQEIVAAVLYLTDAETVTGQTLFVDGGAHSGCW
jgi:NAD(P)-dependent dehydrogenase (short-subunit alcohol dehydrogenase family)